MKNIEIKLSAQFKAQTIKAILAITFFVFTYLVILLLVLGLTAICIIGGLALIAIKPMFVTIALGIGLASLGILVLIFLIKFIFKSHTSNRSHLVEIFESDEPKLFQMINEIVIATKTDFPKRVYLSSDVNAAVFYDSSFWSMFIPIKKNLQIGLGLVNTVTKEELKAILSHEFGHFSQKTMKLGSFVYNLNKVIFNMLYDNESYENIIQRWASMSGYFSIFVVIAVKINEGIQWVLRKLYEVVNKNYMGLSREMEFHADEIAASITGYEPLKSSLLRMTLSDTSFNQAIDFYYEKISHNLKSENIYRDQTEVLNFLAENNCLSVKNELPNITLEEQSKFDKSKLVIKNQWASHPTVSERVKRLECIGASHQHNTDILANSVFMNIVETQRQLSGKLFETISYQGETSFISFENFQNEFREKTLSNSFSKIYNGYYDSKNITHFELNLSNRAENNLKFNELFSDDKVDLVYTAIALQYDKETLKRISDNSLPIKTFDYDGKRYKRKDSANLMNALELEHSRFNEKINNHDKNIYEYFRKIEIEQNKTNELNRLYYEFFEFDKSYDRRYDLYIKLLNDLQFVSTTTPFEQIRINFIRIKPTEDKLKNEIIQLMSDRNIQPLITYEIKDNFERYTSKEWEYFDKPEYCEENLSLLYTALHNYSNILSQRYFLNKKEILIYQEQLIKS